MKNIFKVAVLNIILVVGLATHLCADLEVPGERDPLLAETAFSQAGSDYSIVKEFRNSQVLLKVVGKDGKEIAVSPNLGEQEKLFIFAGQPVSLKIVDLDKNKVPEIICAAMTGPDRSSLYVFNFDQQKSKLVPLKFVYEKENLIRDFLVSDLYQQDGQDLVFLADNQIRVLGKIYRENAAPVVGFYFFEFFLDRYVCTKIIPVPQDDAN